MQAQRFRMPGARRGHGCCWVQARDGARALGHYFGWLISHGCPSGNASVPNRHVWDLHFSMPGKGLRGSVASRASSPSLLWVLPRPRFNPPPRTRSHHTHPGAGGFRAFSASRVRPNAVRIHKPRQRPGPPERRDGRSLNGAAFGGTGAALARVVPGLRPFRARVGLGARELPGRCPGLLNGCAFGAWVGRRDQVTTRARISGFAHRMRESQGGAVSNGLPAPGTSEILRTLRGGPTHELSGSGPA
jgi:hypothetical protein